MKDKLFEVSIYSKNRRVKKWRTIYLNEKDIEEGLENPIYKVLKEKLFIFILRKDYENLNENITSKMEESLLHNQAKNENGELSLEEILKKKVVFVIYNDITEVEELISLKEKKTGGHFFALVKSIN